MSIPITCGRRGSPRSEFAEMSAYDVGLLGERLVVTHEAISRLVPGDLGHIVTDMAQFGEFRRRHGIERRSPVILLQSRWSIASLVPGGHAILSARDGQGSVLPTPSPSTAFRNYRRGTAN